MELMNEIFSTMVLVVVLAAGYCSYVVYNLFTHKDENDL